MPTNEQRRQTAKRKLERQLERRAQQARKRKMLTIAGAAAAAVIVVAAVVAAVVVTNRDSGAATASATTTTTTTPDTPGQVPPPGTGQLPPFTPAADLGSNCSYEPTPGPASKPVDQPKAGQVPTEPAQISASMTTNQGNLGLQLDNAKSPCTVNSFANLAQKGFYDETRCHRLTTSPGLSVLQCGDPTGAGTGGPGYQFGDEYPINEYPAGDPGLGQPVVYPRGTLAMANGGPATNGSQFFLVYKDSQLPPNYTVFGTIDETGLATLDKVAAAGVAGGGEDGEPATDVTITSLRLD